MHVAFILTMPGVGSWNGKWSGEGKLYAVVRSFGNSRKTRERLAALKPSYYYRWNDGWAANIEVRMVKGTEMRRLKRESQGFCGYEWMIDSILQYGAIYANHEKPEAVAVNA